MVQLLCPVCGAKGNISCKMKTVYACSKLNDLYYQLLAISVIKSKILSSLGYIIPMEI